MPFLSTDWPWLWAAELAANLTDAARWSWQPALTSAARVARDLAASVYEEADPKELTESIRKLEEFFDETGDSLYLLAPLAGEPDHLWRPRVKARKAFLNLRYLLFEEGELAA